MSLNYYIAFGYWLAMVENGAEEEIRERQLAEEQEQPEEPADVGSSCSPWTLPKLPSCPSTMRSSKSTDTLSLVRRIEACEWERLREQVGTSVPSLFEKLNGLFTDRSESCEQVTRAPPNSTATSPTSPSVSEISTRRELHSPQQCVCFNCWRTSSTWKSFRAKSPVDSATLDPLDAQTFVPNTSSTGTMTSIRSPLITSPTLTEDLRAENDLLMRKIRLQQEIIAKLLELNGMHLMADRQLQ